MDIVNYKMDAVEAIPGKTDVRFRNLNDVPTLGVTPGAAVFYDTVAGTYSATPATGKIFVGVAEFVQQDLINSPAQSVVTEGVIWVNVAAGTVDTSPLYISSSGVISNTTTDIALGKSIVGLKPASPGISAGTYNMEVLVNCHGGVQL